MHLQNKAENRPLVETKKGEYSPFLYGYSGVIQSTVHEPVPSGTKTSVR